MDSWLSIIAFSPATNKLFFIAAGPIAFIHYILFLEAGSVYSIGGSNLSNNGAGFVNGTPSNVRYRNPRGLACDTAGIIYVADCDNHAIRKIDLAANVSTLAGNGTAGYADGTGSIARFNNPCGVACDSLDNVYVADTGNNRIRKITPAGVVTTIAGAGEAGYADGSLATAEFNNPQGLWVNPSGKIIYVADSGNGRIRRIDLK